MTVLRSIYLLVKLKHVNWYSKASTVVISLKKYNPVIIVVNVNKSSIRATRQSISVVRRANILKNRAPIRPGSIKAKRNWNIWKTIKHLPYFVYHTLKYAKYRHNVTKSLIEFGHYGSAKRFKINNTVIVV